MNKLQATQDVAYFGRRSLKTGVIALAAWLMSLSAPAHATVLSDLAATMQPGEWRELSTTGFNTGDILVPTGGAGNIIEYTDEVQRNPLTKKMYIIGCARSNAGAGNYQCGNTGTEDAGWIEFDENTNTWARMPTAPTDTGFHTYDHAAIDPATGDYYFREISNRVWKYSGGLWTLLPNIAPSAYDTACCGGLEFFPERNELIFVDGSTQRLFVWRPGQTSWSTVSIGPTLGDYEIFTEYNARRKVLYMGGGNGDDYGLVVMNELGTLTRVASSPAELGQSGSVQSIDPNTGNLLLFASNNQIYEYDPLTDTWALRGSHPLVGGYNFMAAAVPVPEYGVVFAVKYDFGNSKVYLYKNSTASSTSAPTVSLSASSTGVSNGGSSTLTWSSTNATSCAASNAWSGSKEVFGTQTLTNLTTTGTYILSCTGAGGTSAQSVMITVASATPAPTVSLTASSTLVPSGTPVTLGWSSANATSCSATGNWSGVKSTNGTEVIANITSDSTFNLTCTGSGGSTSQTVTVTISAPTPLPTVTLSASLTSVAYNGSTTVSWSTANATTCTASGSWSGIKSLSGTQNTGELSANSTFSLTCTGAGGSTSASTTVTVQPAPAGSPTVMLTVTPTQVAAGETATLTWSATNATTCTANGAWSGTKELSGTQQINSIMVPMSFTLTCGANSLFAAQTVSVAVVTPPPGTQNATGASKKTVGGGALDAIPTLFLILILGVRGRVWRTGVYSISISR